MKSGTSSSLMVLLGAGASVEAGIPATLAMTQKMLNEFEVPSGDQNYARIIRFVEAGLRLRQSVRSKIPSQEVNIEDLFFTIEQLGKRQKFEVGPFVNQWYPLLEELEASVLSSPSLRHSRLESAIEDSLRKLLVGVEKKDFLIARSAAKSVARDITQQIDEFIEKKVSQRSSRPVFERVTELMISKLTAIVWCKDIRKVDYLQPLVLQGQGKSFSIATLNYDNTIELACEMSGVPYTVGLDDWAQYGEFRKPPQGIELLKLHGSVDWRWSGSLTAGISFPSETIQRIRPDDKPSGPLVVLFGGGNKLTVVGPFLDLLKAFQQRLEEQDTLLVIGYSFSDQHINEIIMRWFRRSTTRRIVVIDRPGTPPGDSRPSLFRGEQWPHFRGRVDFLHVGASKGIANYF